MLTSLKMHFRAGNDPEDEKSETSYYYFGATTTDGSSRKIGGEIEFGKRQVKSTISGRKTR